MKEKRNIRVAKFKSFEEAEEADLDHYRSMPVEEKIQEFFHILETQSNETQPRFSRVYRILKLK